MSERKIPSPDQIGKESLKDEKKEADAAFIRHSEASYGTYGRIAGSESPLDRMNPSDQLAPDLTEKGVELAKTEAERFFADLDPEQDILFFATSNEMRAVETANIYRQVAKSRGFEVIKPENSRNRHAEEIGEGEIRAVGSLSIYPRNKSNVVIDSLFNPSQRRPEINWDAIADPELRRKYDQASKIIEADDRGSWGANYAAHSEAIQDVFPEVTTAREMQETQLQSMLRLLRFGIGKAKSAELNKKVKILAFGHENYWAIELEERLGEDGIKNCEVIRLSLEEDQIKAEFRGKRADVG